MNLDEKLSVAFSRWSDAREKLLKLRGSSPGGGKGGQLALSPEAADLALQLHEQEDACKALFAELIAVADDRSELLERQKMEEAQRFYRDRTQE